MTLATVSIHAPARGATAPIVRHCLTLLARFNPRTREGCDLLWPDIQTLHAFQSTHPRGVRHFSVMMGVHGSKFQSTHPRGVRRVDLRSYIRPSKFQSTHPRGVRLPSRVWINLLSRVSIHAPARGATTCHNNSVASVMFQSTHPRGVRLAIR